MPKNYPGFIIDRSKRSPQSKHADDFVVCTDSEVGFIAKAYKVNNIDAHNARVDAMSQEDADCTFVVKALNSRLAVVLEIVHWSSPIYVNRSKLKSLLKKALKAYIYNEVTEVSGDGTEIDKQIGAVKDVVRIAESQFATLSQINGEEATVLFVNQLRNAADSLERIKYFFDGKPAN